MTIATTSHLTQLRSCRRLVELERAEPGRVRTGDNYR